MIVVDEVFEIVDENDNVIGTELRSIVHTKGILHRSAQVLLVNSGGKVFLQQRSPSKRICPLAWDIGVAEHLKPGESYKDAAKRGLKEELGIEAEVDMVITPYREDNEYDNGKTIDREFAAAFIAVSDDDVVLDRSEVADGRFFRLEEVRKMMNENSEKFTPWFVNLWKIIESKNLLSK